MKKKFILSGIILLALVLTTGTFAYTYAGATSTTLNAALADEVAITYELSEDQPNWERIMPNGQYASEILVPNATGDMTEIPFQSPSFGEHWDKVDDNPADDGETYVANGFFNRYRTDLYNLTDHVEADIPQTIRSVTVYFRFSGFTDGGDHTGYAKAAIKTHGTTFEGKEASQDGGTYVTSSYEWMGNPTTGKKWTWEEIDELQAGVSLKGEKKFWPAFCTQVYVAVSYEFMITEGEVPEGDLFDIIPHPDYTGDIQVRIYLTNTAQLLKAYRYLNMEIYVRNSLEAAERPRYQMLSIENGVAIFNIEGGSAERYTAEVWGGSYRLISGDPDEWGEGWSITPEFYCEVTQR